MDHGFLQWAAMHRIPFNPSIVNGYYARIDHRTTSVNIAVTWGSGYVTAQVDDGLSASRNTFVEG